MLVGGLSLLVGILSGRVVALGFILFAHGTNLFLRKSVFLFEIIIYSFEEEDIVLNRTIYKNI